MSIMNNDTLQLEKLTQWQAQKLMDIIIFKVNEDKHAGFQHGISSGDLNNDGTIDVLESLTKKELEELGRENGIELDRRKSKKSLVETMRNIMSK